MDINVLLDVFQKREPQYAASARVVRIGADRQLVGVCPAHGLTTLYYLVRKHSSRPEAELAMDRVLDEFQTGGLDADGWRDARRLPIEDFEDAVVATVAEKTRSDFIITRNVDDFVAASTPVITPADSLVQFVR